MCVSLALPVCLTIGVQPLVHVDLVSEGVAKGHGCEEHLDADDEVLVTSSNRALAHRHLCRVDLRDGTTLLQDGQEHAWGERGGRRDRGKGEQEERGEGASEQKQREM